MAIPREIVDRIYDAAKIEEVVGDYVNLKKRGTNMWGLCPFHTEKTPSFSVSPSRNIYKCFGCGKGGHSVSFIMEMEQCSYPEALRLLAKKYHIEIEERELTAEEQQVHDDRESMFVVNDWAFQWFQDQLWNTDEGQAVGLSYFHERGLRDETIRKFGLGYCPAKGNPLTKDAKQQGFKDAYLCNDPESRIGTGLCGRSGDENQPTRLYDRFHDRVIFPFFSISGKHIGFAGRILVKKDNVGKYVNSPESLVYTKGRELYGIFQAKHAIVRAKKCYLVEGQMDCISMSQAGIENVVSSGGTSLTKEQIGLIHRFTDNVTILYDGDAAGVHASLRGIDMFLEQGLNVKVMLFPDGDDPDSFARKHTAEEFVNYIQTHEEDFIHYKVRTLLADAQGDIHKRTEAIHSSIHSIAYIGDKILQGEYIKLCAQLMDMDMATLTKAVNQERQRIYKKDTKKEEPRPAETQDIAIATQPQQAPASSEGGLHTPFDRLDQNSRNLLQMLIRYGERQLRYQGADGQIYTYLVGDYMQMYMQSASLQMENPLYQSFFDEFNRHKAEPDFKAEHCFIRNENQYISKLATDLISSQYSVSGKLEKESTDELTDNEIHTQTIHLLYELHLTTVENSLCMLDTKLAEATRANDEPNMMALMRAQMQLGEIKRQISELLGQN